MKELVAPESYGLAVLLLYWAASLLVLLFLPRPRTKDQFLVADRSLGRWESAFSIAATWVWAPALFLAAEKAYAEGLAGVFWFTVPNMACLIAFAPFAARIRDVLPEGFTLSAYMRQRFSPRVHRLYFLQMTGLAICSSAVQLLAGGKLLSFLTGLSFFWLTVVLAAIALSYSLWGGLKSSVATDHIQMILILLVGGVSVGWALDGAGGWSIAAAGLGGFSGAYDNLFGERGLDVAWSFGLPVTVALLAGPFGDQSFWQRAFATERRHVKAAFVRGALIFGTVPLMMAGLGFIAAGEKWAIADTSLVNIEVITRLLPSWMVLTFMVMLLSGLLSTLDSHLCAVSSLVGHDVVSGTSWDPLKKGGNILAASRLSMVALALLGVAVANIPGMKILYLFLFYGTLRASTLLPTIISLSRTSVSEAGVYWGILISMLIGLPVFSYGNFTNNTGWTLAGSLGTVLTSGLVTLLASAFHRSHRG